MLQNSLKTIDRFLKSLHLRCTRSRGSAAWWSAVAVFLLFASALSARHLTQVIRVEDQLDAHFASARALSQMQDEFPETPSLFVMIRPSGVGNFSAEQLCQIRKGLNQISESAPRINLSFSPFELRRASFQGGKLWYPGLLGDVCNSGGKLDVLRGSLWDGILTDPQMKDLAVEFSVDPLDPPGRLGGVDPDAIPSAQRALAPLLGKIGASAVWNGPAMRDFYIMVGMDNSSAQNLAMGTIIMVSFRFLFGTWISGLIFLATVGFSMALVFGAMAAAGHPMDILGVSLILIVALASLEDFIFLSYLQLQHGRSVRRNFLRIITPGFFTSLTTVLGFASLCVSDVGLIKRFGLWAAVGALIEWVSIFLILPSIFRLFGARPVWTDLSRAKFLFSFKKFAGFGFSRRLAVFSLAVIPLAFLGFSHIRMEQDPALTFPSNHPLRESTRYLEKSRGWRTMAYLTMNANLDPARKTQIVEQVGKLPPVWRVIDSKKIEDSLSEDIQEERIRNLIHRETRSSPLLKRFESDSGQSRALVYLSSTNTAQVEALRENVEKICASGECHLTGEIVAFAELSQEFIKTLSESFLLSLVLVASVLGYLALACGAKNPFSLLLSSFWGPFALLAMVCWGGVLINSVTCIVASTVVGLTGDNAIQFLFSSKNKPILQGMKRISGGSLQCAAVMILMATSFLASYFGPPRDLAFLLSFGFAASFIGDVWIFRSLVSKPSIRMD